MNVKAWSRRLAAACLGLLAIAAAAQAQQYPNRPVTIISDSAAGSTPDAVLRLLADRARPDLGPTSPGGQSSRRHRQHRDAHRRGCRTRWIHALHARLVELRIAAGSSPQCADSAAARLYPDRF